ncbi:uncharacterized protein Z520_03803 [Fonsecaea multimorphosa CBS 102226]|uniref:Cyanovirin-N domain-containing protein n=1 Tax=Fonsecaea multimorphosa CBS 102226 TaxID=1442371 RepID=A0A0D2K2N3_9EURO|nr:uncharacterized protein Z520_03803 [Fonsecaea multimorphosa CBS 102226]KIY00118.1 hypothetical protein Z520_03803 [Fonsecaea multimorphosa CBS 102226]OAL27314.1 hypothetical protein AYO22_03589 [Fonsecaea multimorphosa]
MQSEMLLTVASLLAFTSVSFAGLMPKSPKPDSDIAMKIGCYPTGNAADPDTAMAWDLSTCDGQLNGDNCLRFCTCNEYSQIVCDSSAMSGCSDKTMAAACSASGNNHWYCSCWPAKA